MRKISKEKNGKRQTENGEKGERKLEKANI